MNSEAPRPRAAALQGCSRERFSILRTLVAVRELDEASVGIAEIGRAAPREVARLDKERETPAPELVAHAIELPDSEGDVILVRRPARG